MYQKLVELKRELPIQAEKTVLSEILIFRKLFLQENNFQIRYDACHERNWSDSYLLILDGIKVGYGSVKGKEDLKDRNAVFEFFVLPPYRKYSSILFACLLRTSKSDFVECQSNDAQLSGLLYEFCRNIFADVILFEDAIISKLEVDSVIFRRKEEDEVMYGKNPRDMGEHVLEKHGKIVATGGFLTHYNPPFADLFMEVHADYRKQGLGSFFIQEVKKACYQAGRVPAARCNMENYASRATLLKAGMRICGFMLTGEVKKKDLEYY